MPTIPSSQYSTHTTPSNTTTSPGKSLKKAISLKNLKRITTGDQSEEPPLPCTTAPATPEPFEPLNPQWEFTNASGFAGWECHAQGMGAADNPCNNFNCLTAEQCTRCKLKRTPTSEQGFRDWEHVVSVRAMRESEKAGRRTCCNIL